MLKHQYIRIIIVIACVVAAIGYLYDYWSIFIFVIVALIGLGLTVWGVFDIRLSYFGKTHFKASEKRTKEVSLTFDDGPCPYTVQVLDLLDRYEMKATFFCIGQQVLKYPEIAKRIIDSGHSIGNHSFTHRKDIAFSNAAEMATEIKLADDAITKITKSVTPMYRPPFGVTNPNVIKACKATNKEIIGWSIRSLDTVIKDENRILNRILPRIKPGDIVLLHDTSERTINVLEQLLIKMKDMNLQSIPVDRLLKIERNG